MNKISKYLLTGILATSPFFADSPNPKQTYIPYEQKLREIEKSSTETESNVCVHKAIRYYLNLKEKGEDARVVIGWIKGTPFPHAWVEVTKDKKDYYLDPAYNIVKDGLQKQFYFDREETYEFNSDATIEDIIYKRNIKNQNLEVINHMKENYKTLKNPKKSNGMQRGTLVKSVEDYCRQDSLAWKYYEENIKNKHK